MSNRILLGLIWMLLVGCSPQEPPVVQASRSDSRYLPLAAEPILLQGGIVLTGLGTRLDGADVLLRDGKIAAVGFALDAAGASTIDASDYWITPGLIDVHSHLGVYPSPSVPAHADGNEATAPNTAEVWAEHGVWPQDPGFVTALAGGVTSVHVLPGSANLFGGRGVTLKNVRGRSVFEMKFPNAPHSLKMACGENPKRVYGSKGTAPGSRMGNVAGYRKAWIEAADYRERRAVAARGEGDAPLRNLQLETLAGVLDGEILVHNHCYRADEMAVMLQIAEEFGYEIKAFHHAVEAYKIADLLAESGTCAAVWSDWWGFKMESFDGIRENAALVELAGGCAIIHSDDALGIQRLNQEAAKVVGAAARVGIDLPAEKVIRWITSNPARALGIQDSVGTLEAGKMADVTIWDGDPFSVYTKVQQVYIDGVVLFDRARPANNPVTDFSLGTAAQAGGQR